MKLLKHYGKIIKHHARVKRHSSHMMGGNINHLLTQSTGGNISELKRQLAHMVISHKPKKHHRIKF